MLDLSNSLFQFTLSNEQIGHMDTLLEWKSFVCRELTVTEAEERISDLEDRMLEITSKEKNFKKRMKGNEDSLRDL